MSARANYEKARDEYFRAKAEFRKARAEFRAEPKAPKPPKEPKAPKGGAGTWGDSTPAFNAEGLPIGTWARTFLGIRYDCEFDGTTWTFVASPTVTFKAKSISAIAEKIAQCAHNDYTTPRKINGWNVMYYPMADGWRYAKDFRTTEPTSRKAKAPKEPKAPKAEERHEAYDEDEGAGIPADRGAYPWERPSHLAILGLTTADDNYRAIKRAWMRLAQLHHPDRGAEADADMFARVQEAYDALTTDMPETWKTA